MNIRPDAKANYRRKGTSDTTYSARLRIESDAGSSIIFESLPEVTGSQIFISFSMFWRSSLHISSDCVAPSFSNTSAAHRASDFASSNLCS